MSLRVWLPLDGDLHNQGASNLQFSYSGTNFSIDSNGKIGNCYKRTARAADAIISDKTINLGSHQSMFCWIKMDAFNSSSNLTGILGQHRHPTNTGMGITLKYKSATTGQLSVNTGTGSARTYVTYLGSTTLTTNTWYHVGYTYDGTTIKLYVNGIEDGSHAFSGMSCPSEYIQIGNWAFNSSTLTTTTIANYCALGSINDVRIYDHCLSAAEVHEIAQGLVLHYKLNEITQSNLLTRSVNEPASWTLNQSTCVVDDNALKVTITSDSGDRRIYQGVSNVWTPANSTFTVSFEARAATNGLTIDVSRSNISGTDMVSFPLTTTWHHYSGQIINSAAASGGTLSVRCLTNGGIFWIKNIKLERGPAESRFISSDESDDTIQDSSGYNHNAILAGATTIVSDTPRYNVSTHFSANDQYIGVTGLTTSGFGSTYSFSWWEKRASYSGTMAWGFQNGIRLNGLYNGNLWNTGDSSNNPLYKPGTTTQVSAPTANVWHHFVMTGDGTTCKVYQDGVFWAQAKTFKQISGTNLYINGWDTGTSYKSTNMSVSDFRLYATALTADDALALYHTGAKVDNKKYIHSFLFNETDAAKILKTGVMDGNIAENQFTQHLKYDQNIYIEPDGSVWVRAFHHNNPASNKFASSDTFTTSVYKNVDTWFNMEVCNYLNKWEIMVKSRATPDAVEYKYRWIQQYNPMTATFANVAAANVIKITTPGYTNYSWGGLYHIGSSTYLSTNNGTNGNWWGAVGAWNAHQGGIPGWTVVITTGYEDVYLRIDNVNWNTPDNAKITKNNIWIGDNFIEL